MDDYVPQREEEVDASWLEREIERLAQEHDEWERQAAEVEVVNGAMRAADGKFDMLPDRVFRADGRTERSAYEFQELLRKVIVQIRRSGSVEPVLALKAVKALRALCDDVEHEVIAVVRAAGWSWRSVGETIGVSASVLHRRFAREDVPARQRRRG